MRTLLPVGHSAHRALVGLHVPCRFEVQRQLLKALHPPARIGACHQEAANSSNLMPPGSVKIHTSHAVARCWSDIFLDA